MPYPSFDLTGKVALITGGAGGIGLGMADALAQAGASIIIWEPNLGRAEEAAARLASRSVKVLPQEVDVSDERKVEAGMAAAVAEMGRIDTVIAAAAVVGGGDFADLATPTYRRVLAVNLDGVFFTLRAACAHAVARAKAGDPGASLIGMASVGALHGAARNQAYSAAKAGVIAMIRGIAVEHARYGIRANAILPGWINTDMTRGMQASAKFAERVISRVPMRRWGEPEDFGGLAIYLASDASRFHTGDTLVMDGGYGVF